MYTTPDITPAFPPENLLFATDQSEPNRRSFVGHLWRRAARTAIVEGFSFHDPRHVAASALIAQGCSVKVVQRRLEHASAKVTLETYAHLWPDDEDRTRAALDDALSPVLCHAGAANPCPGPLTRTLATPRGPRASWAA